MFSINIHNHYHEWLVLQPATESRLPPIASTSLFPPFSVLDAQKDLRILKNRVQPSNVWPSHSFITVYLLWHFWGSRCCSISRHTWSIGVNFLKLTINISPYTWELHVLIFFLIWIFGEDLCFWCLCKD